MKKQQECTPQSKKSSKDCFSEISKFFEVLGKHNLNPIEFQLLYDASVSNSLSATQRYMHHERIDSLEMGEWITSRGHAGKDGMSCTEKGLALLAEVNELFAKPAKKKTVIAIPAVMVTTYNELFPRIKIPMTGKYARSNEKELTKSFEWFINEYGFDWKTILTATEKYVMEKEADNWAYMRTSKYFLRKQGDNRVWSSDLADYCMAILGGVDDGPKNHFQENIV